MPDFDWERPLRDLHELAELTGGPDGARRLAWSEDWRTAREWLLGKLAETDATRGARLRPATCGRRSPASRRRSSSSARTSTPCPHGGWLDGCLGVLRGAGGPARAQGRDAGGDAEADRLGRRGGRALRPLTPRLVRRRRHAGARRRARPQGHPGHRRSRTRCKENDIDLDTMGEAELPDIAAYLELHIEQGPRLEEMGKPAAAVIGCFGVERHAITFTGKSSHAGSTPMNLRRDAFLAAGRFGLAAREIGDRPRRRGHDRHRHRRAGHPDDHQPALRGHARPARVQARAAARHARRRQGGGVADRRGGGLRGRVEADLADRPDPVRRDAGGPRRAGGRRDHRRRRPAAAAVRRAARRRRGRAPGADGDGLLAARPTA